MGDSGKTWTFTPTSFIAGYPTNLGGLAPGKGILLNFSECLLGSPAKISEGSRNHTRCRPVQVIARVDMDLVTFVAIEHNTC